MQEVFSYMQQLQNKVESNHDPLNYTLLIKQEQTSAHTPKRTSARRPTLAFDVTHSLINTVSVSTPSLAKQHNHKVLLTNHNITHYITPYNCIFKPCSFRNDTS